MAIFLVVQHLSDCFETEKDRERKIEKETHTNSGVFDKPRIFLSISFLSLTSTLSVVELSVFQLFINYATRSQSLSQSVLFPLFVCRCDFAPVGWFVELWED
jgi:hypothetical protein